jgi:transaldolase
MIICPPTIIFIPDNLLSFISAKEAMAAGEMGCHYATIMSGVLAQLSKLPYDGSKQPGEGVPKPMHPYLNSGPTPTRLSKLSKTDPLAPADWDGTLASTDIDYLANNGAELEKAIEADPVTKTRLYEALEVFKDVELRSKAAIEEALKSE